MIKLNADTRASGKDVAAVVADISMQGNEAWGIEKLTLPILYGRYKTDDLPSTFQKILDKKGSKHTYIHVQSNQAWIHGKSTESLLA